MITSFIFRVRNVPAALYKAMGGFATNGVNMTKLESYQVEGQFSATQFYADIEGHPEQRNVRLALEELEFFTSYLRILGVYKASPYRAEIARRMADASGRLKTGADEVMGDGQRYRRFQAAGRAFHPAWIEPRAVQTSARFQAPWRSMTISSVSASPISPIIRLDGKGQGWFR